MQVMSRSVRQMQILALDNSMTSRSLICNPFPVQAYAVLSDPDTRSQYNVQLEQALADEDDSFTGAAAVTALQHVICWLSKHSVLLHDCGTPAH